MQRRRPPKRRNRKAELRELTIDSLGSDGEGRAGGLSVPFALPGEKVVAEVTGRRGVVRERSATSPARAQPLCPHFGLPGDGCGGCTLQHLGASLAQELKERRLLDSVRTVFPDAVLAGVHTSPPRSRRRAKFSVTVEAAGFKQLAGRRVVPLEECAVLHPDLFALLRPLRGLARSLGTGFQAEATLAANGTDLALRTEGLEVGPSELATLSAYAEEHDLARLALDGLPVSERRAPFVEFGGVPVSLPPGSFLQATDAGEKALQREVLTACKGAGRVADLFSGLGTFALPLAGGAEVIAADSEGSATDALSLAARRAGLPVTTEARDLYRRPLQAKELAVDAVVFDPPRAGAGEQAAEIAKARPGTVLAVSCNPQRLARDLRHFAATYDLTRLVLVDQFGWSPHIEGVAVLKRR
ncbi:class I SAM-dependent RNA methyltransferase [Parvularcula maris]|uniref:Class I SAM-dependent RNA methyltransferase n=1 Tax=Parvularcula maris TaxID=2965077 RepID=A0A9X2L9X0_9PROT|nr:hypothetical protein [Parvularcula maris]MCQ8185742.1 hypothetical protein [Parvularcula maris]